jgi:diguanylate cyclase (GGDEF)-like protein
MPDPDFYLREEPVCALDPLLLIPRIEYAQSIFSCILGSSVSYSLVILDMINFHRINDVFGYDVGDSVLLQFISFVRLVLPLGSIAMRFRHGDEFLFFLRSQKFTPNFCLTKYEFVRIRLITRSLLVRNTSIFHFVLQS